MPQRPETRAASPLGASKLRLGPLVCVMFFTVSGGPFGIESVIGRLGPGTGVLLLLLVPLLWAAPIALMAAELAGAIPEEGGYYCWVTRGLGKFAGMQVAWVQSCAACVDAALYPALFVGYLGSLFPALSLASQNSEATAAPILRWLVATAFIGLALILHLWNIRYAGRNAAWTTGMIAAGVAAFVVCCLAREGAFHSIGRALASSAGGEGSLAASFAILMWSYYGWEDNATIIGEIESPRRNYPRALAISLPLITLVYLAPVLAGLSVLTDPRIWSEDRGWPALARMVGGSWLAGIVTVTALLSVWALFNGQLLYLTRLPYVLARDGWLPAFLGRIHPRTGSPSSAVIVVALVIVLLSTISFSQLVVLELSLYSCVLTCELVTLVILRVREPNLTRPFRVPGGMLGLLYVVGSPLFCVAIVWREVVENLIRGALGTTDLKREAILFVAILGSGAINYYLRRRQYTRPNDVDYN